LANLVSFHRFVKTGYFSQKVVPVREQKVLTNSETGDVWHERTLGYSPCAGLIPD